MFANWRITMFGRYLEKQLNFILIVSWKLAENNNVIMQYVLVCNNETNVHVFKYKKKTNAIKPLKIIKFILLQHAFNVVHYKIKNGLIFKNTFYVTYLTDRTFWHRFSISIKYCSIVKSTFLVSYSRPTVRYLFMRPLN